MQLYLDSSALVKLVVVEAETAAVRNYLDEYRSDVQMSAALARTELLRAAALTAPDLRAVVTYDSRLADAVATQGVPVASPG
jgi:hypothetical protein